MRMVAFGIVATLVWGLAHLYVGHRLIVGSRLRRPWNVIAWCVLALHASLSPIVFMIRRGAPESIIVQGLQWTAYVGMGFLVLLLALLLVRDAILLLVRLARRKPPAPVDPSRRNLLAGSLNLGIFATTGAATAVGFVEARKTPRVDRVEVPVPDLPPELEGFRIVQISDVHVGPTIKRPFVETVVREVNALDADIVAVTGDLVDGFVEEMGYDVAPLQKLEAKYGKFFVTGNHEYYWDGPGWSRAVERLGLTTLTNEHRIVRVGRAALLVGGVTDLTAGRFVDEHASSPKKAMEGAPRHDFSVLLAHQPGSVYEAADAGFDLQLSGHTHGGQFYPWNFFVGLAHPFTRGFHRFDDRMWIYVNRGTGYWGPPQRLGVPSEITLLVLRRA